MNLAKGVFRFTDKKSPTFHNAGPPKTIRKIKKIIWVI